MFLKVLGRATSVTLPDGSTLALEDLPLPSTRRWVASRKAAVVRAVEHGLLTEEEAHERYSLSEEEFALWQKAARTTGGKGLEIKMIPELRKS